MKIGIIKEGKAVPDKRVVLTPAQCKLIQEKYSPIQVYVQSSKDRCFSDQEYRDHGISIVDSIAHCDVILGVKEVPVDWLIPNKIFMFFSHTIKKQEYNRVLLQQILEKNIQLIDYECIVDENTKRIIGFGRFAGIVGTYNGFLTYGQRFNLFTLKPAFECKNQQELIAQLKTKQLGPLRIVLTGDGRVSHGAKEMLNALGIQEVNPKDFMHLKYPNAVFTNVLVGDYMQHKHGFPFVKKEYYQTPTNFHSILGNFVESSDMLITGHVWKKGDPVLLSKDFFRNENNTCKVIVDITCDLKEPIACTLRACKIGDPFFYYDPQSEKEINIPSNDSIAVMSVDNLPCELPKDSSENFGREFIEFVLPAFMEKNPSALLERATICKNGQLTERFSYLMDFVTESLG